MNSTVVLGLVGALSTLIVIFELLRRQRLREKYAVIWVTVAMGTVLLALAPGVLTWASEVVGVQLPVNLLFFLASMVLLLLSIQYSYEIGRLEDRTRTLAEEIALLRMQLDVLREPTRRQPASEEGGDHPDVGGQNAAPRTNPD